MGFVPAVCLDRQLTRCGAGQCVEQGQKQLFGVQFFDVTTCRCLGARQSGIAIARAGPWQYKEMP